MKVLLTLFVLLLLGFSHSSYANLFKCKIKEGYLNGEYIIKVNEGEEGYRALVDVNPDTGKFEENSKMYSYIFTGEVMKFSFGNSQAFDMIVFSNSKKGDENNFRAIFFEKKFLKGYTTTIIIETWKADLPFYLFDDWHGKKFTGNCE